MSLGLNTKIKIQQREEHKESKGLKQTNRGVIFIDCGLNYADKRA